MEDKSKNNSSDKDIVKRAYEYRKNGFNPKDSGLAFLVGGYITPLISAIVIMILISFVAAVSGLNYNTLTETRPFSIIILLAAEIGFIAYYLFVQFSKKKKRQFKTCIGFSFKNCNIWICLIAIVLAIAMSILTSNFIASINAGLAGIGYTKPSNLPFQIDSVGNMFLGLLVMCLIPAICEELLFRGVVLGGLLNYAKTNKAKIICVVISALFFALIHQSALQFVYPFIMGLVFGFIYLYTGNLLYGIILHFVSNGFVVVANYYYYVNGIEETAITYNVGYVLGAVGLALIAVGLAVGAILLIKKIAKGKSVFMVENEKIEEYKKELQKNDLEQNGSDINTLKIQALEKAVEENNIKTAKSILLIGLLFGIGMLIVDIVTTILS